ncbi:ANTAR domain-containing protein [Nocardioides sp. DS6]|uniref:ANTAR domain-containing protein n=1 Tax=Nocardioides eburneus TaxID=3231482 RepID=A0ABV3SX61_9ACTN
MTLLQDLDRNPLFQATAAPYLVMDARLVIRCANPAYLHVTGRRLDELVGEPVFRALPDNPADPGADGVANLRASFDEVFRTGRRHRMRLQRYDVPVSARGHGLVRRYWAPVNSPLLDHAGRAVGVLHQTEDVTPAVDAVVQSRPAPESVTVEEWQSLVTALAKETLAHAEACTTVAQLREALDSRVVLEQAKGVLVALRGCAPEDAFEVLRSLARSSGHRLHDVAREVVANAARGGRRPAAPRPRRGTE